ncbi:acyltransferase domain-containing protein [Nonomuraea sp. NPDC049725]|uniref:acyltransferase domain-containing protein n=1 Tax=Nonomuraea sp. NPDC049725 TaxID=3154508 RepID=UPI0034331CB0
MRQTERRTVLLLPGQGAQYPRMAAELYREQPAFTAAMDEFFDACGRRGCELRDDWLSAAPRVPIDDVTRAQPLLFAVNLAIGRALADAGRPVDALLGHSVGELAAAALAGVFSPADGAELMCRRADAARLMPPGGMLAVAATPDDIAPHLSGGPGGELGGVVVGAWNAPRQCIVSGPDPALEAAEETLRGKGFMCRRVRALQPFHSPVLRPAAEELVRCLEGMRLSPPRVPVRSCRTGRWVTDEEAVTPEFWALQLAEPVLFWPALDGLLTDRPEGGWTLVEACLSQLAPLARRHRAVARGDAEVITIGPGEFPMTASVRRSGS